MNLLIVLCALLPVATATPPWMENWPSDLVRCGGYASIRCPKGYWCDVKIIPNVYDNMGVCMPNEKKPTTDGRWCGHMGEMFCRPGFMCDINHTRGRCQKKCGVYNGECPSGSYCHTLKSDNEVRSRGYCQELKQTTTVMG